VLPMGLGYVEGVTHGDRARKLIQIAPKK